VLESIPLVALPEGVTGVTVPVEILEVRAEGPDSENNLNITVKCKCNNDSSDDWHLLKVRTQLLNGIGEVIDEANDTYEELIVGQSQYEFEPSFWGINTSLLGTEPEQAHVVVFLTASRKFSFDLGKVSVPEVAFSTVEIPAKGMSAMQMVSCSLWKGLPDDDKDSRIEVRSMLQNLTAERLPLVKIMAVVSDKQGEELTTVEGEDELRAGELLVLNTSSYAKDKKLKGATIALSMDMYWLTASGITQRQGMEIIANEVEESSEDNDESGNNSGITEFSNREAVLAAVEADGYALEYASPSMQADYEIVLKAVEQNGNALQYVSESMQAYREVVLRAVEQNGTALQYASQSMQADYDIVLAAVSNSGSTLECACQSLQADREIVLKAVEQYGNALQYASASMRADREIVLKAVSDSGLALEYASASMQADREIVQTAIEQNVNALQYASASMQGDRDVVLKAIEQNGLALEYASQSLQADRDIVLRAVEQNGIAIKYASQSLKTEPSLVLQAVDQSGYVLLEMEDPSLSIAISHKFGATKDFAWPESDEFEEFFDLCIDKLNIGKLSKGESVQDNIYDRITIHCVNEIEELSESGDASKVKYYILDFPSLERELDSKAMFLAVSWRINEDLEEDLDSVFFQDGFGNTDISNNEYCRELIDILNEAQIESEDSEFKDSDFDEDE
jgi:hypothetical protein